MNYEQVIDVQWRDVDYNQHVRHSAYFDYAAQARIRFFQEAGYHMSRLGELGVGPILFHEECTFLREIKLEDTLKVVLRRGEMSATGDRWIFHHELINQHQKTVAHVSAKGAWMDLEQRKLTTPPQGLAIAIAELPLGSPYVYPSKSVAAE